MTQGAAIVAFVIGLRFRFKVAPDEPGDPKIFLPRIVFLIPGLLLLGFGLWEGWRYFQLPVPVEAESHGWRFSLNLMEMNLEPQSVAGVCGFVFLSTGGLFLWLALSAERSLRKSKERDESGPMFVSARQFVLVASLVAYLCLFGFVISPWLCKILPGMAVVVI
jgi:hypothetical protein